MKRLLIAILSLIATFCFTFTLTACTNVYNVNFIVDGETYLSIEVSEKETITIPDEPTKEYHTFNGWFLDEGVWEQPINEETAQTITLTEDLNVYAYFTLNTIEGVTFENDTFTYDGEEKTIEVQNLPDGATVTYSPSNVYVDAGSYPITATITKENYIDKVLTATLTIQKAVMTDINFDDTTILAGNPTTIEAFGYPEGSTVTYTNNGPFSEKGTYFIDVKIENPNYFTYEKTATLNIVSVADLMTSKYLAGKAKGSKYSANGGNQYFLCVVEFNDDFTQATLYATKYDKINTNTDYITNVSAKVSLKSDNMLDIVLKWKNEKNSVELKQSSSGEFTVNRTSTDSSYWDHIVADGFSSKPTMYTYSGKYDLDLSTYADGDPFAPTGWSEEVMNSQGQYEASSGNAKVIANEDGKALSIKIGENANNVYRYTYMFGETPLGEFSFFTFNFSGSAAIRVKLILKSGNYIHLLGDSSSFFEPNASTNLSGYHWIDANKNQRGNIVGIQIEVYQGTFANTNKVVEIAPFSLSYSVEI